MRAQPAGSHYIDGTHAAGAGGRTFESVFPGDGEAIARLVFAGEVEIEAAFAAAARGQRAWAAMTGAERGRILMRAARIMRERNEALAQLETLDTGKPIQETRVADAASGADCLEFFGGLAAGLAGEHVDLGPGAFAYTRREPLGIVVAIGAWNYPIQIASWKAAPALAAGNAMIFKPSELTPLSALALAQILTEAELPAGVLNVLQGDGAVGQRLVEDRRTAKVSVTGSVATGARVSAAAGIKPVTLELGGKSPLVVFADADLDAAVTGAMVGNFYSSGQVCSNGTRVFVERQVAADFLARLEARTRALVIGDPRDEGTEIGPLISARQRERVLEYMRLGTADGARLVCGGADARGLPERGFFVAPTVFAGVADDMRIAREEIFGPVASVLVFDSEDEVIARANATPFGLAAGVFTRDLARAHRVAAAIDAGIAWINAYNLTPVEIPFGGTKQSGFGRENGRAALEHYSRLKSVYVGLAPQASPFGGGAT